VWIQTYSYDSLDRLTGANETSSGTSWSEAYSYDQFGNRWVPTPLYPTLETPILQSWFLASNRINGWSYDGPGNVLSVQGMQRNFTYDAENRQITASINGVQTTYTYDGDGKRVQRVTSAGTTTYAYDASGQLIAEFSTAPATDSGTTYLTADHLGSTRLLMSDTGVMKKVYDYLPFGEEILGGTSAQPGVGGRTTVMGYNDGNSVTLPDKQSEKFTSKERDAETGLDYFGARYFSSAQGRFTSADPALFPHDITDPQSWNTYAYTRNNPLRYVDPNGEDWIEAAKAWWNAFVQPFTDALSGNPEASGSSTGPLPTTQQVVRAQADAIGKGVPFVTDAMLMLDPTGIGALTHSAMSGDSKGTLLAAVVMGTPGERLAANAAKGRAGEVLADIVKNTERIESATGTAKYRVPDILDHANQVIGDIKNFSTTLNLSNQLRDFLQYAKKQNYSITLRVADPSKVSKKLQKEIEDLGGKIESIVRQQQ